MSGTLFAELFRQKFPYARRETIGHGYVSDTKSGFNSPNSQFCQGERPRLTNQRRQKNKFTASDGMYAADIKIFVTLLRPLSLYFFLCLQSHFFIFGKYIQAVVAGETRGQAVVGWVFILLVA